MTLEQLENEWRMRRRGRRKELVVIWSLGGLVTLVALYVAWAFWLGA